MTKSQHLPKKEKPIASLRQEVKDKIQLFATAPLENMSKPTELPEQVSEFLKEEGYDPAKVKIISYNERSEYARKYGIPNAIDVGYGVFGKYSGSLYIDDETGEPVAYAPPPAKS